MKTISYFYDPLPAVRTLRCPVLLLYGEHDVPAAIRVEVRRVRDALRQAGNRDVTIQVIPHANHNFFVTRSGNAHEADTVTGFAPELFPLITSWLTRRVHLPG